MPKESEKNNIIRVGDIFCFFIVCLLWGVVASVSINHLFPFWQGLHLTSLQLGILGWITFTTTILALGCRYLKHLCAVFLLFFILGYAAGPFLEPPGDVLDHLRNSYSTCGKTANELKRTNKGFWQYSMVGNFICHDRYAVPPENILQRIDVANGVFWGVSGAILFLVALRAGLSVGWAFCSVWIAFLFMGTTRFSYFRYYSFAPSFSSIWIFWLWIAAFFFKTKVRYILPGIISAGLGISIIVVNHIQEAVFLALVCGVWVALFLHRWLTALLCNKYVSGRVWCHILLMLSYFFLLFVLPQWTVFQGWFGKFFPHDYWQANQEAVFTLNGIHLLGKVWGYRIAETLGLFGFLPLLLVPLFAWPGFIRDSAGTKWRVLLLGLLPLLVYSIPLLNFIWLANCVHLPTHIRYYYRMCYSALFWLPLALVLQNVFQHFYTRGPVHLSGYRRFAERVFLAFCLSVFTVFSLIKSPPLYGKLDFIYVESRQWWDEWQPMVERVLSWKKERVETDYITGYVLHAVFDVPLKYNRFNVLSVTAAPKRNIEKMVAAGRDEQVGCLINLHGFTPTWVPWVTGHWDAGLADPSRLYRLDGVAPDALPAYMKNYDAGTCFVYY